MQWEYSFINVYVRVRNYLLVLGIICLLIARVESIRKL